MKSIKTLVAVSLLIMSSQLSAQEHPAYSMVKDLVQQVLVILEEDTAKIEEDDTHFARKIEEVVFPHIDFEAMTRRTVGKSWRSASDEQKKTLIAEFKQFLMNTYAMALTDVGGGEVDFKPFKPSRKETNAIVKSSFSPGGDLVFPVDYWLQHKGEWKIVNFVVAERNLITTYRENFAEMTRKGGVEEVIRELKKKNSGN